MIVVEVAFSLQEAKRKGLAFSVETCPHYLALTAEEIPDGDTTFKCNPPLRDAENRDKLWQALMVSLTCARVHSLPVGPCLASVDVML